jgi:hypothetical protein
MIELAFFLFGLAAGLALGPTLTAIRRGRAPHRHEGAQWDGWFEHCRCGTSAGDRRDENGYRMILFDQWPDEARTAQR